MSDHIAVLRTETVNGREGEIGETNTVFCLPIQITTGIRVVADPPAHVGRYSDWHYPRGSEEYFASLKRDLEDWARELYDFLRDHRSQDLVSISIEKETGTVCSVCRREWEPVVEDGVTYCAGCGAEMEKKP